MTRPADRKVLVNELRDLVESGNYEVDAEIVAAAVVRTGSWDPVFGSGK